jgi:hypothetical protein
MFGFLACAFAGCVYSWNAIPAEQRCAVEGVEKLLIGPKLRVSCKVEISNRLIWGQTDGGRDRDQTGDPLLAKPRSNSPALPVRSHAC